MPSILNLKKTIKIGIDGGDFVPFGKVDSGIKRIVDSFLKETGKLKNEDCIFNYYYFDKEIFSSDHLTGVLTYKKLPQKLFASWFLPLHFLKDANNVFLGFSGYLPPLINLINTKKVVFLYDLGFLKFPQFYFKVQKLKNRVSESIKSADRIITLSDYAKKQIVRHFSTDEKKIVRLYPGLDHFGPNSSMVQIIELSKFFLFVGVIKPVKNIQLLFYYFYNFLKQSSDRNYQLVIIGQKEEKYFENLLKDQYYLKLKEKIIFKDNILDQELIKYYLQSIALLNFSYEEGFCFPVLEALSLGKKAIVNNLPIYHEFKDRFANLLIGKNEKEIVQFMCQAAANVSRKFKYQKPPETAVFKWANFTKNLLWTIVNL